MHVLCFLSVELFLLCMRACTVLVWGSFVGNGQKFLHFRWKCLEEIFRYYEVLALESSVWHLYGFYFRTDPVWVCLLSSVESKWRIPQISGIRFDLSRCLWLLCPEHFGVRHIWKKKWSFNHVWLVAIQVAQNVGPHVYLLSQINTVTESWSALLQKLIWCDRTTVRYAATIGVCSKFLLLSCLCPFHTRWSAEVSARAFLHFGVCSSLDGALPPPPNTHSCHRLFLGTGSSVQAWCTCLVQIYRMKTHMQRPTLHVWRLSFVKDAGESVQGSHCTWKTWKNRARPWKPGKTGGFGAKTGKILQSLEKNFDLTLKKPKSLNRKSIWKKSSSSKRFQIWRTYFKPEYWGYKISNILIRTGWLFIFQFITDKSGRDQSFVLYNYQPQ